MKNLIDEFPLDACRQKFRRALQNVPSFPRIETTENTVSLLVRPKNLLQFGQALNRCGMDRCQTSNRILRYLDNNKDEFIQFEHSLLNQ